MGLACPQPPRRVARGVQAEGALGGPPMEHFTSQRDEQLEFA